MTAKNAFHYARYVLNARFEEGEPIIAQDAFYSLLYAQHVLNARFELGEPIIAEEAYFAFHYAKLFGRFELGEPAIAKNAYFSPRYFKEVLVEKSKIQEKTIALHFAFYYAKYMLKERLDYYKLNQN